MKYVMVKIERNVCCYVIDVMIHIIFIVLNQPWRNCLRINGSVILAWFKYKSRPIKQVRIIVVRSLGG